MSKIRVLSDHLANQIAAGEVVERPASVAKELVENAIDAGARRISIDVEAGGRRLLRIIDDGEGMTRDDAIMAFERHATSKIATVDDLAAIETLGFRGEALASIASVARVELVSKTEDETAGTRVFLEGGKLRDVKDAAHPRGTTITVRDLFFNVPARRKFLRSEPTESFHLTNLVTHYALAHPEIAFTLTNNGRETLRAAQANDLRERAYQVFGAEFLENLLEVNGGHEMIARVRGFVSAPRERRTSRDNQFLFVNGRFVRDRLVSRALSEGYRSILPHGVYPVALLFLAIPLEEVDVNVHPAKTEVRFRRAAAVSDSVREAVRGALASGGFVRATDVPTEPQSESNAMVAGHILPIALELDDERSSITVQEKPPWSPWSNDSNSEFALTPEPRQPAIEFGFEAPTDDLLSASSTREEVSRKEISVQDSENRKASESPDQASPISNANRERDPALPSDEQETRQHVSTISASSYAELKPSMPPVDSAAGLVREVPLESVSTNIRPLGQLDESFIIATDDEGLLLIDQHVAHERILFDKFNHLEASRPAESQQLLIPETFDLTPAQAASFDSVSDELESYGFGLMRLSGRTVAIKAVPADLPQSEARNMLAEVLDTIDSEKRGAARTTLREEIAASLACRAAIKVNMPLSPEKMRWLIDRLLLTSSPTTCPHGRPVILRLATRDILKGFHRI